MSSRGPAPPLPTTAGKICATSTPRCSRGEWPGSGFTPTADPQYVDHLLRRDQGGLNATVHQRAFVPHSSRWLAGRGDPRERSRAEAAVGPVSLTALGVGAIVGTG